MVILLTTWIWAVLPLACTCLSPSAAMFRTWPIDLAPKQGVLNSPLSTSKLSRSNDVQGAESAALKAMEARPLDVQHLFSDPAFVSSTSKVYVYDDIDWMSMTCDGTPIRDLVAGTSWLPRKHTDDYWFAKAAYGSERVMDPEDADVFVVPALLNTITEQITWSHKKCCVGDKCQMDLLQYTDDMLGNSTWFKRHHGKDHVIVCSHYYCPEMVRKFFPNMNALHSVSFEENSMRGDRCRIASPYVGTRCPPEDKKDMFVMVASMHPDLDHFKARRDVCEWVTEAVNINETYTVSNCGAGDMCPALAQTRFGFHCRGDTLGSNRPNDLVLNGVVPIFTDRGQFGILPPFVPWKNMSVFLDVWDKQTFLTGLEAIVPQYEDAKAVLDAYAPFVDWETSEPFNQYMYLFKKCIAEA